MTEPLVDRSALVLHRRRAQRLGPALFLHETLREMVEERLAEVNRTFKNAAIVTAFGDAWAGFGADVIVEDDDRLDLNGAAHDLVIHALGLHWANDPVGQLVQCRRALKPDGMLICICFGGRTLFELRAALAQAESAVRGGLAPRVAPMGEVRDLGSLLQRAGLALPVADVFSITATYATPLALMKDLRAMGETNALAARDRRAVPRGVFTEAARLYQRDHGLSDGRVPATFDLVTLTGWAPAATQQKPLRPGTAQMPLSAALGQRDGSG